MAETRVEGKPLAERAKELEKILNDISQDYIDKVSKAYFSKDPNRMHVVNFSQVLAARVAQISKLRQSIKIRKQRLVTAAHVALNYVQLALEAIQQNYKGSDPTPGFFWGSDLYGILKSTEAKLKGFLGDDFSQNKLEKALTNFLNGEDCQKLWKVMPVTNPNFQCDLKEVKAFLRLEDQTAPVVAVSLSKI